MGIPLGDEGGLFALGGEEGDVIAQSSRFDRVRDVEDVVALRDGEGFFIHVAANDPGVDLGSGGGVVEAVFAGVKLAALEGAEEVEDVAAADDVGLLELGGDGLGSGAGGYVDVGRRVFSRDGRRREGNVDEESRGSGDAEREEKQCRQIFHRFLPSGFMCKTATRYTLPPPRFSLRYSK